MPGIDDLERALFGRSHAEIAEDRGETMTSGDSAPPPWGPGRRLRVDEIELLLANREQEGHAKGHTEGWEAACAMYRAQEVRNFNRTVQGTLALIVQESQAVAGHAKLAAEAYVKAPRARTTREQVANALEKAIGLAAEFQAIRDAVAENGIELP